MTTSKAVFERILVATDFSPFADAALSQAVWLARRCGAELVLAHTVENLRQAAHVLTYQAKIDLLTAEGELFQKEIRSKSDDKLRQQITAANAPDLKIRFETLLGEPFIELTHAVQQEGYDLVMCGTRGASAWKQFFVGSTSKRLIRKCPASVWIVKAEHADPPKVILAASDFSEVSRKAVLKGLWLAEQCGAELHLLHVIESKDIPDDLLETMAGGRIVQDEITQEATARLHSYLNTLGRDVSRVIPHLAWGHAWQEIARVAKEQNVDLITLGTVGRSGIKGVLLGNTAERVLDTCDCTILTVKPDDFVSPIAAATWPLHP